MKKQISQRAKRTVQWLGLALVVGLLVSGCATDNHQKVVWADPPEGTFPPMTNAAPGTGLSAINPKGDRLQIGDQVAVKFSGTTDQYLKDHEERIKEDGTITLPYILGVQAVDKTLGELQKDIHDRYVPGYYKRLTVTVTGEQRVYYVGGQVKSPGRQVYLGATTVTKAVQSAGDFTDFAARWRVELTRADGKTIKVDCDKAAKDPALDLPVYPGDKIHVPQRSPGEIFRW